MLKLFNLLMLAAFSVHVFGQGKTKCVGVRMCWANAEAVVALAHAVRGYFLVEQQHSYVQFCFHRRVIEKLSHTNKGPEP